MIKYLIAMEREAEKFRKIIVPDGELYIIGIGAINLPETTNKDILVNIGYAGGYKVSKGTVVEPGYVIDAETREKRKLTRYFGINSAVCFTSDLYLTSPLTFLRPSIYDMELYKIASIPHNKLFSLKIVSDSQNEAECEAYNDDKPWWEVERLLKRLIKEQNER